MPLKYPVVTPENNEESQPFFILGSGRNGSTLLGSMLAMHPQLGVVPEQFTLGYVSIKFRLKPRASWEKQVQMAIDAFSNPQLSHWEQRFYQCKNHLIELEPDKRSLRAIVDYLYRTYLDEKGQNYDLWGDKSPKNTLMLKHVVQVFPKARYLFLVRDGRDVVRSYVKNGVTEFGEFGNLNRAAWRWNDSLAKWNWLKTGVPATQLHVTKYEDLVTNTREKLSEICDFLEVPYNPSVEEYMSHDMMNVSESEVHRGVRERVNNASIGLWREYFSPDQIRDLEKQMGPGLKAWGYV